jgi:hypothetical protein
MPVARCLSPAAPRSPCSTPLQADVRAKREFRDMAPEDPHGECGLPERHCGAERHPGALQWRWLVARDGTRGPSHRCPLSESQEGPRRQAARMRKPGGTRSLLAAAVYGWNSPTP